MNRCDSAVSLFREGYSCSQSVLAAFASPQDLSRDAALRLAGGFGGGIARTGGICGAVSGAVMVLGLRHGSAVAEDGPAKDRLYERVHELFARFTERQGTIVCRELLGCDPGTPEGLERAREQDLFTTRCPGFVRDVAEILEGLI